MEHDMHTYIRIPRDDLYVVGYYHPTDEKWQPLRDCATEAEASAWVSFLNGGTFPKTEVAS
jgi:hypothetical protein